MKKEGYKRKTTFFEEKTPGLTPGHGLTHQVVRVWPSRCTGRSFDKPRLVQLPSKLDPESQINPPDQSEFNNYDLEDKIYHAKLQCIIIVNLVYMIFYYNYFFYFFLVILNLLTNKRTRILLRNRPYNRKHFQYFPLKIQTKHHDGPFLQAFLLTSLIR